MRGGRASVSWLTGKQVSGKRVVEAVYNMERGSGPSPGPAGGLITDTSKGCGWSMEMSICHQQLVKLTVVGSTFIQM